MFHCGTKNMEKNLSKKASDEKFIKANPFCVHINNVNIVSLKLKK